MKVLFINPPDGFIDRTYLAPPLGLLTLAAVVREYGHSVDVLDLNLEVLANPVIGKSSTFYETACTLIMERNPDVVGFTSMCLESHVSLELARRIKISLPEVINVFGGTHFGAIAAEILDNFPFVDFVIKGEAERALPALLCHNSIGSPSLPGNVFYRCEDRSRSGLAGIVAPVLEEIPFPAYDLVDLQRYFNLNPFHLLNYEAGRGCVFKCSFCYSPFQYGDAVRHKKPELVVEELRKLSRLGARHIFFVQDNLLNSPRWASNLCRQIVDAGLPLTWECYATYPQLNESIIDLLAEAGCKGVFTGIDAVSSESQERLNKPFLRNWEATSQKLSYCLERGLQPLCAFILEEPEQNQERNEAVINTALRCVDLGCEIHINTLSIYNGTSLSVSNSPARYYSSAKAELLMDVPEVVQTNEFAKHLPHLFPYHSTTSNVYSWEVFVAKVHTLSSLVAGLRRTLFHYVVEEGNSIWASLDYIDSNFVAQLKLLEPWKRREATILEFNRRFDFQKISQETRTLLSREVAGVILSKNHSDRLVNIIVGSKEKTYSLAWFLDIQGLQSFEPQTVWPTGVDRGKLNSYIPSQPRNGCRLALLSQSKTIKVFSASSEFKELLLDLQEASELQRSVRLSDGQLEQLEQDGWIWPRVSIK